MGLNVREATGCDGTLASYGLLKLTITVISIIPACTVCYENGSDPGRVQLFGSLEPLLNLVGIYSQSSL